MTTTRYVLRENTIPKDNPALKGADLPGAMIYAGTIVDMLFDEKVGDYISPKDGWAQIVGPTYPEKDWIVKANGTYKNYGKYAWLPLAHLKLLDENPEEFVYRLTVDAHTGTVKSIVLE